MYQDSQSFIINNKEYTLDGIPDEFFLNGSPSYFPDRETRLPIVESSGRNEKGYFEAQYEKMRYPRKGVITPPMLTALNAIKKVVLHEIKGLVKRWYLFPIWYFIRWDIAEKIAEDSEAILRYYYVPPDHSVPVAKEYYNACQKTFEKDIFTDKQRWIVDRIVLAGGMVLEGDDSYRYRAQDAIGLIDKQAFLDNPSKEFSRVLVIFLERDTREIKNEKGEMERSSGMIGRFESVFKVLPYLLKIPMIKNRMKAFISYLDIQECLLDDADFYHCLPRYDYRHRGMDYEHKMAMRVMIDEEYNHGTPA